ncbi:DUF1059 domain-containing protein [Nocardia sp. NPDC055029]|uniref:DUF1059 domain-containing protein n=1 Tax=Nocardia sp. NPDC060259 TaxID=3347088 RepID=UPI0036516A29
MTDPQKRYLTCPCGEWLTGADEDGLVERARQHLAERHPGHSYTREQILFLAH